jgi:hypothetical protein
LSDIFGDKKFFLSKNIHLNTSVKIVFDIFKLIYGHAALTHSINSSDSNILTNSPAIIAGFFLVSFDKIKQPKAKSHRSFFGGNSNFISDNSI